MLTFTEDQKVHIYKEYLLGLCRGNVVYETDDKGQVVDKDISSLTAASIGVVDFRGGDENMDINMPRGMFEVCTMVSIRLDGLSNGNDDTADKQTE